MAGEAGISIALKGSMIFTIFTEVFKVKLVSTMTLSRRQALRLSTQCILPAVTNVQRDTKTPSNPDLSAQGLPSTQMHWWIHSLLRADLQVLFHSPIQAFQLSASAILTNSSIRL